MKRLMPSTLITFLQNNRNCIKADCFVITLPTGAVLYITEGQWDITFPASTPGWTGTLNTFKAVQYGVWSRGRIISEASSKCNANTMSLTCVAQPNVQYPGLALNMMQAAVAHLFDGATVTVYTVYMPIGGYGDVSVGIETKWQGTITKIPVLSRARLEFECSDPFYLLNMKVPSRLLQSNCPWKFTDVNCTLIPGDYTVTFTAKAGSTNFVLIPLAAFTQADGYFSRGVVTCLTGANAGLSQTVKVHAGGQITVMTPWILPVASGDTFSIIKGCDLTLAMCSATVKANGAVVNNSANFGGTPYAPVPSTFV